MRHRSQLIHTVSLLFGLNLEKACDSKRSSKLYLALFIVLNAISLIFSAIYVREMFYFRLSLATLAYINQLLATYLSMLLAQKVFLYRRSQLRDLLRADLLLRGQTCSQNVTFFGLILPTYALYCLFVYTETSLYRAYEHVFYMYRLTFRDFLLWLYLETLAILNIRCRGLLTTVNHGYRLHPNELIAQKERIRKDISILNELFAVPLVFIYCQIPTAAITLFIYFVTDTLLLESYVSFFSQVSFVIFVFVMARRCNAVMSLLIEVEHRLLLKLNAMSSFGGLRTSSMGHDCPQLQWQALRFDENWDSIHIGCFVHDQRTVVSFMASCVTCLAVVLQFDFKVVRVVNDLAAKHGEGPLFE